MNTRTPVANAVAVVSGTVLTLAVIATIWLNQQAEDNHVANITRALSPFAYDQQQPREPVSDLLEFAGLTTTIAVVAGVALVVSTLVIVARRSTTQEGA